MKNIYKTATAFIVIVATACGSPAKKQHEDKERKINKMQNVGAGASDDKMNNVASGSLTDSTNMDTTGNENR